jgi:hypothetical protein
MPTLVSKARAVSSACALLRQCQVVQYRQVRKEIERLEYHSDLGADDVDVRSLVQRDAVHDDAARIGRFEMIDAPQ